MLFVSSLTLGSRRHSPSLVSISESRCFSFQGQMLNTIVWMRGLMVSISESRCFSFQDNTTKPPSGLPCMMFQSRNRDAFRFKLDNPNARGDGHYCFNLGIEMLFVSSQTAGTDNLNTSRSFNLGIEMLFVSRYQIHHHHDLTVFCFNLGIEMLFVSSPAIYRTQTPWLCFNLGIEMLFVSSCHREVPTVPLYCVSISESRCFSFQGKGRGHIHAPSRVSISESRCFSFQVKCLSLKECTILRVSISESRCFSFQVHQDFACRPCHRTFQSRNRDAFRFKRRTI